VANYCFTNLLLQQQQAQLGVVVSAMTAVQPDMTVKKFIPMCLRILLVSPSDRSPRTPSFTRRSSLSLLVQKYLRTGTKVQILTADEVLQWQQNLGINFSLCFSHIASKFEVYYISQPEQGIVGECW